LAEKSIFGRLYDRPFVPDREVCDLLRIGKRQLQRLIHGGKLKRCGDPKFARIDSESVRRYIGLPARMPENCAPWTEILAD
jgi:hypothetical protein